MESKPENIEAKKSEVLGLILTDQEKAKAAELAQRIKRDSVCSKEEATRVAIEYVKKFGTV